MMDKHKEAAEVPCESFGANCSIRIAAVGAIWGLTSGPSKANKLGLTGLSKAGYVVKSTGSVGLQCGFFTALYYFTNCKLQNYRQKKDWLNASVAGAVTGAVFAVRTGSVVGVLGMAALISAISTAAEISTSIWSPSE